MLGVVQHHLRARSLQAVRVPSVRLLLVRRPDCDLQNDSFDFLRSRGASPRSSMQHSCSILKAVVSLLLVAIAHLLKLILIDFLRFRRDFAPCFRLRSPSSKRQPTSTLPSCGCGSRHSSGLCRLGWRLRYRLLCLRRGRCSSRLGRFSRWRRRRLGRRRRRWWRRLWRRRGRRWRRRWRRWSRRWRLLRSSLLVLLGACSWRRYGRWCWRDPLSWRACRSPRLGFLP